jgi:hypothetical protein
MHMMDPRWRYAKYVGPHVTCHTWACAHSSAAKSSYRSVQRKKNHTHSHPIVLSRQHTPIPFSAELCPAPPWPSPAPSSPMAPDRRPPRPNPASSSPIAPDRRRPVPPRHRPAASCLTALDRRRCRRSALGQLRRLRPFVPVQTKTATSLMGRGEAVLSRARWARRGFDWVCAWARERQPATG